MKSLQEFEIPVDKLRWKCKQDSKDLCATDDIEPCGEIIGQERAIEAIKLGLQIEQPGYNVFVVGYTGTGRTTTIKRMIKELGLQDGKLPADLCYVQNFGNPDQPRVLQFPAGEGAKFRDEMKNMVEQLREQIPAMMESDELRNRRKSIIEEYEERQKSLIRDFEKRVKDRDFAMTQVQMGQMMRPDVNPVISGNPTPLSELEAKTEAGEFPKERYDEIKATYDELAEEMVQLFKQTRQNQKELNEKLERLHKDAISPMVYESISIINSEFKADGLEYYLTEIHEDIIKNLGNFQRGEDEQAQQKMPFPQRKRDPFHDYQVNLVVDNSRTKNRPLIIETNPNFRNLFGSIERVVDQQGFWRTDFTRIKAGAMHHANGGYLILDAMDALVEPGVWTGLKRTLRSQKLEIAASDPMSMFSQVTLKPEPVELDLQVIMIGMPDIYYMLFHLDPDFSKIFKVKADFDTVIERNEDSMKKYNAFARKIVDEHKLLPFDQSGIGALIEYGIRIGGRQNKLSTRFNVIADVMRESSYWAQQDQSDRVRAEHVSRAIDQWVKRVSLPEDKLTEMIEQGTILIATDKAVTGQINGLSVYSMGEYSFGKPTRITARTSVGTKGIINIEKEAQLSGSSHSKGVLIINGYLQGKFAQNRPLSMNASLCFEQSYGGVDGDSASSTEIYAILSSLAEVPIRQDIAVTGSVNQNGEIQAIGGVNQKIEGFFDICKARGLTGDQGVMIPKSNVPDLMLHQRVVDAVNDGKFRIYAVETIEEGIEILTGKEAGEQAGDGTYPDGTIFHAVEKKLDSYAEAFRKYSGGGKDNNK
ncbi:MAG: AAA family ATPase [candidate division Zixibacteria bacterium]|nr:AAA family ATPase [candidate division Zixibacteria bacterium]